MNLQKLAAIAISMGALTLTLPTNANAALITLIPTADGDIQTFGSDDVNTIGPNIDFVQSGGLARNGVLEFDLSGIADGSIINSVSLDITLTRFVSSGPADIDIFAYNGDGIVDITDFSGGTQVNDTGETTANGGSPGDVRSFSFTDLSPITVALINNLLTIRIETDSFASVRFASLEHLTLNAAQLNIDFTAPAVSQVPLPAALPLFGTGLAAMGFIGWRRKRKANASA